MLTAITELSQGRDRDDPLSPLPGSATQRLPAKNNQAPPPIDLSTLLRRGRLLNFSGIKLYTVR